jgi:SNF2 family DNA or RNA helicase
MELRKTCAHPYLIAPELEPKGITAKKAYATFVDASEKLRVLQLLLPKLKERGHRVLIFSQFIMVLDILERCATRLPWSSPDSTRLHSFLEGEGHKFVRLDGNASGADRQSGIDAFNAPGSDIFCYILTTRAGGVGINLATADTVLIFDHDWSASARETKYSAGLRSRAQTPSRTCKPSRVLTASVKRSRSRATSSWSRAPARRR